MTITIQPASPAQRAELIQLLSQNHLSGDDLPDTLANVWLALDNDKLIGSVGIEVYDHIGLLRSVCVNPDYRSRGIAQQLYEVAVQEARKQGVQELYLLTTTADRYFERRGFARIERTLVPVSIQQTGQFRDLCPASAIIMQRTI